MAVGELRRDLNFLYRFALWFVAIVWPIGLFFGIWAAADSGNASSLDKWYFDNRLFFLPLAFFSASSLKLFLRKPDKQTRLVWGTRSVLVAVMIGISITAFFAS